VTLLPPGFAIPTGRPVSLITGGSWEGTGVEPPREASADRALELALKLATETAGDR
jgi:hypothetical protein